MDENKVNEIEENTPEEIEVVETKPKKKLGKAIAIVGGIAAASVLIIRKLANRDPNIHWEYDEDLDDFVACPDEVTPSETQED